MNREEYAKRQMTIWEAWLKNRKRGNTTPENVYPKPDNFWGDKFLERLSKDERQ